ncbi:beta-phosphoglucomutase [Saccharibacillus kuerlensis]|uniref:Beta-phosphoglucomutase n=1 Tax=Saccharibacillus kuerlensis TaxID=459527 RepID=A0ABQ2KY66_9BACL|nr:beta-phosphoglucomutase [Saccharibacillus kuerlensis]GGN96423.1 beta-phosphoglucomutase [Saccharibacillus kuerlensis]
MNEAIIFDLDGVIVSTDHYHYRAWKEIADREHVPFDEERNGLLRGVSREKSLEILLELAPRTYSAEEKKQLAEEKNKIYRQLLQELTPADILPGVLTWIDEAKEKGLRIAIGSSSKNTDFILERIGLSDTFDAVVTGADVEHSKPAPDIFLLAAERLGAGPEQCWVIEDAPAGIVAAKAAGMKTIGVGEFVQNSGADRWALTLGEAKL